MIFNKKCYSFQELHFKSGFLDRSVDITYIITMINNKQRHQQIFSQLKKYVPIQNYQVKILHILIFIFLD
jgi:hypothetical protein